MAQTLLITAQDVRDLTDIQQNVDAQAVEPRFGRCQENYIRPVLGDALFEDLCLALAAERQPQPVPLPDALDLLHTQLLPALAQWVFYKSLAFLVVKATNRALTAHQDAPSDAQYRAFAKEVKAEAEARTGDLKRWLDANAALFANYQPAARAPRLIGGIVL